MEALNGRKTERVRWFRGGKNKKGKRKRKDGGGGGKKKVWAGKIEN